MIQYFLSFAFGFGICFVLMQENQDAMQRELNTLKGRFAPLMIKCEPDQLYYATKADQGPWVSKCIAGSKRRAK